MSYKKVFVVFIFLLFIIILIGGFLYSRQKEIGPDGQVVEREGFFSFLPFGRDNATSTNPNGQNPGEGNTNSDGELGTTTPGFVPRLRQISTVPTAGSISFERIASTTDLFTISTSTTASTSPTVTVIRFIERATGHIYETLSSTFTNERISNQTIPKIYTALFEKSGNNFIAQTVVPPSDVVESFVAKTAKEEVQGVMLPRFEQKLLPDSLLQLILSPLKDKIFYLTQSSNGSIGFISSIIKEDTKQIFTSPLQEWTVQWPKTETLVFTTKPAAEITGITQFLTVATGKATTILSNIKGLTTLTNPDLSRILYSESTRTSLNFYHYDVKSSQKEILTIKTLPEKCIWSKKQPTIAYCAAPQSLSLGKYPEDWYQGTTSFNDYLWKLDLANKEYTIVLKPEEEGRVSIDMTDLSFSEKEDYLYFTNKKDLTLWSYHLQ